MYDDEQVEHPITKQWGWEDADDNIWVPTGEDIYGHGGAHWDVVYPNGIKYHNVYPASTTLTKPAHDTLTVICGPLIFYTNLDEIMFFEWIKKISCIIKVQGKGRELYLSIDKRLLSDQDIRYLKGLFIRYNFENSKVLDTLQLNNTN